MINVYEPDNEELKLQLFAYVNDYIAAMRKLCTNIALSNCETEPPVDHGFIANEDLLYLENYAIELFNRMLESSGDEIKISAAVDAEISRISQLRLIPDEVKLGFSKFLLPYNEFNLPEREDEIFSIQNRMKSLPNLRHVMSEIYINDMIRYVSLIRGFCLKKIHVSVEHVVIVQNLTECNLALRDALVVIQGNCILKEDNIEMVLNLLEPLLENLQLAPIRDKVKLATTVLRAVLNNEMSGLNYRCSVGMLITDLSKYNVQFRMQQSWLNKLPFSSDEAVVLIISLINLSYMVNYDQEMPSRINILAGMDFYRASDFKAIEGNARTFCFAEYVLFVVLKFKAHLSEEQLTIMDGAGQKLRMCAV